MGSQMIAVLTAQLFIHIAWPPALPYRSHINLGVSVMWLRVDSVITLDHGWSEQIALSRVGGFLQSGGSPGEKARSRREFCCSLWAL